MTSSSSLSSAQLATLPFPSGTGRYAPSPSGDLHLGNLRTAILAWAMARRGGKPFYLRVEDLDRVRPGAAERQIADLAALGLDWDASPGSAAESTEGKEAGVLYQSTRLATYEQAVAQLREAGLVYECYCTRRDIREAASAPHVPPGHYPGTCLTLSESEREEKRAALAELGRAPALRLAAPSPEWTVFDELHGSYTGAVDHFVVRRADGVPAYNLAAVVDDAYQGVDQVVRGFDLLSQAPAQAQLAHLLGAPEPTYAHVPLALAPSGARLAKRDGAVTLSDLRGLGWSTADIVSFIGASLGVPGARCASDIADALGIAGLRALPTEPWVVTPPSS